MAQIVRRDDFGSFGQYLRVRPLRQDLLGWHSPPPVKSQIIAEHGSGVAAQCEIVSHGHVEVLPEFLVL
jgi:hypothetical protein